MLLKEMGKKKRGRELGPGGHEKYMKHSLLNKQKSSGTGHQELRLRPMNNNDIPEIVAIHLQSFSGFFLSFLGKNFLSLYYRGVMEAAEGITFVYLNNKNMPCGFVAGTSNPSGFYSKLLKKYWFQFSLASLTAICQKPSVIRRIGRALFHPSQNPTGADIAGLFSIGVLPELHGTGIGQRLAAAFLKEAKKRGCKRAFLTTDQENNAPANAFYHKIGFRVERQFVTPEGRRMNEYWIELISS